MITGTATEDQTLTADTSGISDDDGLGTYAYQWLRDGVAIGGATASTYVLSDNDVGTQISVEVSYTDGNGTPEGPLTSAQTAPVANVNDNPVGNPVITGTATEDQTLTADTSGISDDDGLGTYAYQWLRDGVAIGGATASTYILGDADVGTQISVEVSYTDGNGTPETVTSAQTAPVTNVNDTPTGSPVITGTATEDQALTADTSGISDDDGLGTYAYQWLRDGVAIGGATASTYTLGDNDVGTQISVEVSYTDGNGTPEGPLTSAQTAPVANVNDNPVGNPVITGTATEDQTLTADTSGISDDDGLGTYTYQWLRDGVVIGGATASTYTLGDNDVGMQISVEVSYTDGNGTPEGPLTSAQTAPVANVNDNPSGSPVITGTTTEDQTLTADTSGISDDDGLGAYSYQWLRDGVAIGGATASTYVLGDNDVGTQISVEVSYTDGNGTPEGPLTSAQTAPVANVNDNPVGNPVITGTATEDQTLTADTSGISDDDGLGTYAYQWLRDGVAIGGATASTYVLGDNDVGTQISVEVSYTDGNGTPEGPLTSAQTAPVVNVNDDPVITSDGGGASASVSIDENTTDVTTVTSTDVDGGTPVFSIVGGPEAGLFTIDPITGELSFNVAPDFEFPTDGGGINQYDVIVQVSDGNGGTDTQAVRVIVLDVDESVGIDPNPEEPPITDPTEPVDSDDETDPLLEANPVLATAGVDSLDSTNTTNGDKKTEDKSQLPPESEIEIIPDVVSDLPEEIKVKPIDLAKFEDKVQMKKIDHNLLISFDRAQAEIQEHSNIFGIDTKTVTLGTGTLLTAGYVSWILRSGALLSAVLSTIPAWSSFDPIVIMTSRRKDEKDKALMDGKFGKVERVFEKAAQSLNDSVKQVAR